MSIFLLPDKPISSLDEYLSTQVGGKAIEKAHEIGPQATIDLVTQSGLRGRGGAGFPTGNKWAAIASQTNATRYLVCNAAEGEPGTFKDRMLMRINPYQLIEGISIAAFAIDATQAFICLKASFEYEIERITQAVKDFQTQGLCTKCEITIVAGPEEYLYGEEKAMLEVIEGNEPLPRWLPPYIHGLYASAPQLGWQSHGTTNNMQTKEQANDSNPTLINNVETFSNVTHIVANGADWFRQLGTETSPGTIIATVVGDVDKPGVTEVEMGTTLASIIDSIGGGLNEGRSIKAVFSGVSNEVIVPNNLDVTLDYEDFKTRGLGLGSAGFIVYDDTTCMVDIAYLFSRFLSVESCGQCPPCKIGSTTITDHLEKIRNGNSSANDLETILGWLKNVADGNRCYLAVEEQNIVYSIIREFGSEFENHISNGTCDFIHKEEFPKITNLENGIVTYDESFWRKQPDWTYS